MMKITAAQTKALKALANISCATINCNTGDALVARNLATVECNIATYTARKACGYVTRTYLDTAYTITAAGIAALAAA